MFFSDDPSAVKPRTKNQSVNSIVDPNNYVTRPAEVNRLNGI